ncbi:hypothetical protein ACFRAM_14470 [Paenibacillus sp. NPDC056722]|uniref:hypothetical protein n=1 Tax=Paenibacillus sp. NPDC056722 TaxID=3345924 RepID=UPI0036A9E1A4
MSELNKYIGQLEQITLQLIESIDQSTSEQLAEFAELREQLVFSIEESNDSLTTELKHRISTLSEFDHIILSKMNQFKQDASDWLSKQGAIKVQKNAYNSSYAVNSMFIDWKN